MQNPPFGGSIVYKTTHQNDATFSENNLVNCKIKLDFRVFGHIYLGG